MVRYSAIRALNNSQDEIAENTLIDVLEKSEDANDLTYSNSTLNRIGTPKAIPHNDKHLKSRKRDMKLSAKLAIEAIKNKNGI